MLTPEYLLHVSEGAEEIAARLHTDIVKQIARRVLARQQRGADYILTAADKWRIQSLLDAGYMQDDIAEDIAKATRLEKAEVAEAFRDAGVTATKYDDEVYEAMGIPTGGTQSPYFTRLMQRNYEATMGTWENYARTTADASQQTFISTMDDIYTKVATGSQSYTEAFTEAINKLAETGVVVFYPSGHKDTIETATLRCVRTGISQASAQIQLARMDEFGVDLVVVSSHMGARPSHQVWQGKVYSRSGSSKKYPDFVSSTGYGTGDGLCGWNCRHNFSPYYEGMKNPFDHYTKKENNELYEKTQKQRSMERAIRKTKREAEVLKDAADHAENGETASGLSESAQKARKKLKRQMEAYSQYCRENDLRPLPERLKIAKAGRLTNDVNVEPRKIEAVAQEPERPKFKTYTTKLKAAMKTDDYEALGKLVDNNPENGVKSLWERFADKCKRIKVSLNGGAYSPALDTVEFCYETHEGMSRYSTAAHEMSHMFDSHLGKVELSYKEVDAINTRCKFGSGMLKTINPVASNSDLFLSAVRADKEKLAALLRDSGTWAVVRKDNGSAGIQDAMDGLFSKKAATRWGHGDKYYNRFFNGRIKGFGNDKELTEIYKELGLAKNATQAKTQARIYETASEAWANVGSALTCGGPALEYFKKYMPNTVKAYLQIAGMG